MKAQHYPYPLDSDAEEEVLERNGVYSEEEEVYVGYLGESISDESGDFFRDVKKQTVIYHADDDGYHYSFPEYIKTLDDAKDFKFRINDASDTSEERGIRLGREQEIKNIKKYAKILNGLD